MFIIEGFQGMSDKDKAAQVKAHLLKTTISYPQYKANVAAGKYTPKDGSTTEWGQALAILATIGK